MPTRWELRLYAAAAVAVPVLDLAEDRIHAVVLTRDYGGTPAESVAMVHALRAHSGLWQVDVYLALGLALLALPAVLGLLHLARPRAPRTTAAAALTVLPGVLGLSMHTIFWNLLHGAFASGSSTAGAVAAVKADVEAYPPFVVALVLVILGLNLGLLLLAVALGLSGTVPWWAAACAAAFPLADLVGTPDSAYPVFGLLWLTGWAVAARALLRLSRRAAPGREPAADRSRRLEPAGTA